MVVKMSVNEDGSESKHEIPVAPKKHAPAKGGSDLFLARQLIESLGYPVVEQAGRYWGFNEMHGWHDCTDQIVRAAHRMKSRNARDSVLPIVSDFVRVPDASTHPESPVYWERIGGLWEGRWEPLQITDDKILFTDGILHLPTGSFEPTGSRIIYGPRISAPWSTETGDAPTCETFLTMLNRAIPNADIRAHFQEIIGTILQPHSVFRGQIVLWGGPGTGKTTLATAIAVAPGGATGVSFVQESELVKNKWTKCGLVNKFANISDDSSRVRGWIGFAKSYTSGTILVEPKFGQVVTAPATAKLISTCNEMQDVADASGAMNDRVTPFLFDQRLDGHWDSRYMTARYWSSPERRAGILTWLIEGLTRYRKRGHFEAPAAWLETKTAALKAGDSISEWLQDNVTAKDGAILPKEELIRKMPVPVDDRVLNRYMLSLFRSECTRRRVANGERARVFANVCFKETLESEDVGYREE